MGCGCPLTGGSSRASIRRLTNLVDGVLPHHFLCEVKHSFFLFLLPFCVFFCIFFDNKSMFHRLLLHWHFYFSAQLWRILGLPAGWRGHRMISKSNSNFTQMSIWTN